MFSFLNFSASSIVFLSWFKEIIKTFLFSVFNLLTITSLSNPNEIPVD